MSSFEHSSTRYIHRFNFPRESALNSLTKSLYGKKKKEKRKKKKKTKIRLTLTFFTSFRFETRVFVQKFLHENIITQEYYIHKSIKSSREEGRKKGRGEKKPKLNTFSRDNSIGKMSLPSVLTRFRALEGRDEIKNS